MRPDAARSSVHRLSGRDQRLSAALINSFAWVFYIFGLILLITAGNLLKPDAHDDDSDGMVVRPATRFLPASAHYDGDKLFTVANGTPSTRTTCRSSTTANTSRWWK